jgi:hypothetical protein
MRSSSLKFVASALVIVGFFTFTTPATYAAPSRPAQKQKDVAREGDPIHRFIRAIKRIISQDAPVIPIPQLP